VGFRACLDAVGESNPGRPARSLALLCSNEIKLCFLEDRRNKLQHPAFEDTEDHSALYVSGTVIR